MRYIGINRITVLNNNVNMINITMASIIPITKSKVLYFPSFPYKR